MNVETPKVTGAKLPEVDGIDLWSLRDILLTKEKGRLRYVADVAIAKLRKPADEVDALLRRAAAVGYLKWSKAEDQDWELTELGSRLLADEMRPRITRKEVDAILEKLLQRVRRINADPNRLARVAELRLFGSALYEDRDDYGDVDVDVVIGLRRTPEQEIAALKTALKAQMPTSWNYGLRRYFGVESWDSKRTATEASRGIRSLSFGPGAIETLGCQYRVIYRFDVEAGVEMTPDEEITPRTTPEPPSANEWPVDPMPEVTVRRPSNLLQPDEKISVEGVHLPARDLPFHEAAAWSMATSNRPPSENAEDRLAGAYHLFDDWKNADLTGLELVRRVMRWADENGLWDNNPEPIKPLVKVKILPRYRAGILGDMKRRFGVERVADRIDADMLALSLIGEAREVSPKMIAANHALAVGLGRLVDEINLSGNIRFELEMDLSAAGEDTLPRLPDLKGAARKLQKKLEAVKFPDDLVQEAKSQEEWGASLVREIEVEVCRWGDGEDLEPGVASRIGMDWDRAPKRDYETPFEGEDEAVDFALDIGAEMRDAAKTLPGCSRMWLSIEAPVKF